jgi:O-antigen/teichoic acid export membrane protein
VSAVDDAPLVDVLGRSERTGVRVLAIRLATVAASVVGTVMIARALGPHGRGLYALPVAQIGIAMTIAHLGLEHSNVYLSARGVELRRLWSMSTVAALVLGAGACLVVALANVVTSGRALGGVPTAWVVLVMAQLPLLLASLYWAGLLQLSGRLVDAMVCAAAGVAAQAGVVASLFAAGALTPFRALAVLWLTSAVTALLLWVRGRGLGLVGGARVELDLLWRAARFGVRAYLGLILVLLLLRIDQVIVRARLGFTALGVYSVAVLLAEAVWLLTDPFAAAVLPHQVRAADGDDRRLGYATARLNVVVAALAAVAGWALAPYAVPLVFGARYSGAVWPFRLLLPGVVLFAVQRPLAQLLVKQGRLRFVIAFNVGALVFNVAADVLLLPRFGIGAASVVSSVTYAAVAGAYVVAAGGGARAPWRDVVPTAADARRVLALGRPAGTIR